MKKIVAIGGGSVTSETIEIDRESIRLTGKGNPKLCYIPTASENAEGCEEYFKAIKKHFEEVLDCEFSILYLLKNKPPYEEIEKMILSSDIIYVGGGNTKMMMEVWDKAGVSDLLRKAYNQGIVMSGLSAGAICWFKYGNSDSKQIALDDESAPLIQVKALGLINALLCPHYDVEEDRKPSLKKMMKTQEGLKAIALDNCAAIEIVGDEYRIITSKDSANGYSVYWKNGKFFEEKLEKNVFKPLLEIIS